MSDERTAQQSTSNRKPSVGIGCLIGFVVGVVYCIIKLIFHGEF